MDSPKKYNIFEPTLQVINSEYVGLKPAVVKANNEVLKLVLEKVIAEMKILDGNFKKIFNKFFYGGSFYDDLKVGCPNEFDIDLLLVLPKCESCWISCNCVQLKTCEVPGFVYLQIEKEYSSFLAKFTDDNKYLQTTKLLNWIKSLVHQAINKIQNYNDRLIANYSTSGPAITLHIYASEDEMIDVDLVPCILFGSDKWPSNGFRSNPTKVESFFIVPKNPRSHNYPERCWRLSFQQQERCILFSKQRLKPALRLLKKTRDSIGHHQISSYYLKSIVLREVHNNDTSPVWDMSLSFIYMHLLKKYRDYLKEENIPYFWYEKNNLLSGIKEITIKNHYNSIVNIINTIERRLDDPFVIAQQILPPHEYKQLEICESKAILQEVEKQQSTCILL